ncbi:hypothetical protein ACJ72_07493 [Emergomyces africanus]|uniref:Aminoglycoside phosphotransferase domain-containing protein n=1 Tax=Emergomyces africanus TaxID=1955775 RepID=A0A1B7NNL9_9EURO|nr:hypothetical protein ACJ72_07493 [Emergomyces africanus]
MNGGCQRGQQTQQEQCEAPQEQEPERNGNAAQLEPKIGPPITTAVDVVYSPSFAKAPPPIVSLEEFGDISPHIIAPGVIRLPGTNRVLKYSPFLNLVEAETLVTLAEKLPRLLPVPRAYNAYNIGEVSYIIMDYVPGPTLAKCWKSLSPQARDSVVSQLRQHVDCWRTLTASYIGSVGERPCQDSIFAHPYYWQRKVSYGPYYSRHCFNIGAVDALRASRPDPSQYDPELENKILATTGDEIVFTHGDLIPANIIFCNGKVTIIDWGEAGYSIKEREFYEAKKCLAFPSGWAERIPEFIPAFQVENKFWEHVVDNMRIFCGV